MTIKKYHRIIALSMAFLLFATSASYSIDVHYCQGKIKGLSLFGTAESCHEGKKACPKHSDIIVDNSEKNNCCSNHLMVVDNLDENYVDFTTQVCLELNVEFSFHHFLDLQDNPIINYHPKEFKNYRPPLPEKDIPILNQSFLL